MADSVTSLKGDGTIRNPYQLHKPEHLNFLSIDDAYFILTSNIDCSTAPITGVSMLNSQLDGEGYTIQNATIKATNESQSAKGLVGTIRQHGSIKNTKFHNCTLICDSTSTQNAGIIAGEVNGDIVNCEVTDSIVNTYGNAGAIAGSTEYGVIKSSKVREVTVSGALTGGGIVGNANGGEISNSTILNSKIHNSDISGAICGMTENTTVDNNKIKDVAVFGDSIAGGIIGYCNHSGVRQTSISNITVSSEDNVSGLGFGEVRTTTIEDLTITTSVKHANSLLATALLYTETENITITCDNPPTIPVSESVESITQYDTGITVEPVSLNRDEQNQLAQFKTQDTVYTIYKPNYIHTLNTDTREQSVYPIHPEVIYTTIHAAESDAFLEVIGASPEILEELALRGM